MPHVSVGCGCGNHIQRHPEAWVDGDEDLGKVWNVVRVMEEVMFVLAVALISF